MEFFFFIAQNILSPAILFFIFSIATGFIKTDLEIPESIGRCLAIYLIMAIGFKGGVAIANTAAFNTQIFFTIAAGLVIGFLQPILGYALLRLTTKIDAVTAAATAAHYGSVSIVTFATAVSFLKINNIIYAGYIVAVLAMMEAPAIISAIFITRKIIPKAKRPKETHVNIYHEIFANGAITLLFGAFIIGWLTGQAGADAVNGFFYLPFQGILCFFMLDMGLLVAKNLHQLRNFTWKLVAFAVYMPLIGAIVGLATSYAIGLDVGTGTLFMVLCASASYIAVPAAMRLILPEAKAAIYLPMSLAITFPLNVTFGVPIYFNMAKLILAH